MDKKKMLLFGKNKTYYDTLKSLFGANLLRYYPLNDAIGSATAIEKKTNETNTATDVVFNGNIATFNGTSSKIDIQKASLVSVFNPSEIAIGIDFQVSAATEWTDGLYRTLFHFRSDGNNYINVYKNIVNNQISIIFLAGGTPTQVVFTYSGLNKSKLIFTYSKTNTRLNIYINGSLALAETTLDVAYVGNLLTSFIGTDNGAIDYFWKGNLSNMFIVNREVTAAEVARLI